MEIVPKNPCHQLCIFASLPPSYFHASQYSQCTHARPAFPPRSLQLPPSYFHASQSIHARPALPSRSLQQRSPQAISKHFQAISRLSTPSALVPSFLPSFLSSFLPSPFPSCLPCSSGSSVSLPSRRRKLNENPSIGDAFGKKSIKV